MIKSILPQSTLEVMDSPTRWKSGTVSKEMYTMLRKTQMQSCEQATMVPQSTSTPTPTLITTTPTLITTATTTIPPITKKAKKSSKKKKPPSNKPLNPYAAFYRDNFLLLKEQHPDFNVQEIAKLLGTMWENDTVSKQRYTSLYKTQKQAYKDQPQSAFNSYFRDHLPTLQTQNPDLNVADLTKVANEMWERDTTAKELYTRLHDTEMQAIEEKAKAQAPKDPFAAYYRDNIEKLCTENPDLNAQELAKLMRLKWETDIVAKEMYSMLRKTQMQAYDDTSPITPPKAKSRKKKKEKEPSNKPLNPYASFYRDNFERLRAQHPDFNVQEIAKLIGTMWENDTQSKTKYTMLYKTQKQAYKDRPQSAFNSYFQDNFESLQSQNPELDVVELTKLATAMWEQDSTAKDMYTRLHDTQMQLYDEKLKQTNFLKFQL